MNFKLIGAAALAALTILAAPGARAQSADGWTIDKALQSERLDYSKLNNPVYDFADIAAAKGDRLSDTQVAKILKIARHSGQRFKDVLAAVNRGETFSALTLKSNMSLSGLRDVQPEKDEIAAFESAYLATGASSARRNKIENILAR